LRHSVIRLAAGTTWPSQNCSILCRRASFALRRLIEFFGLGLVFIVGISAFATPLRADEPAMRASKDSHAIVERGIIRVAITTFDLPAFHWRNAKGELVGPEIDLVRTIGRLLKVGVVFVNDCPTFDAVIEAVADGRADIGVSKLSQTSRRLLSVQFSDPYLVVRQALLFNRFFVGEQAAGRPPEEELRHFSGTIGVIAKSAYVDFARRHFPNAQIAELQTWDDAVAALVSNRVDALYRDEFEIRRVLRKNPSLNVRFGSAAINDHKSYLSFAVCSTCSQLKEFINYQIEENSVPFTLRGLLATATPN
jgi:ABC-type amino acid transport substrate-binding protein